MTPLSSPLTLLAQKTFLSWNEISADSLFLHPSMVARGRAALYPLSVTEQSNRKRGPPFCHVCD